VTAAAAFALAKTHGVDVVHDGGKIVFRSRGFIRPDVLASLRSAAPDMLAALRSPKPMSVRDPTGDELLEALRARGFAISITGSNRDLRDIVAERRPLFERLLAWRAPDAAAVLEDDRRIERRR
jgi:hypothetical protein